MSDPKSKKQSKASEPEDQKPQDQSPDAGESKDKPQPKKVERKLSACVDKTAIGGAKVIVVTATECDVAYRHLPRRSAITPAVRCRRRTFPVGEGVELGVDSLSDADIEALTHHPRLDVTAKD